MVDDSWHAARMPYDRTVKETVRSYWKGRRRRRTTRWLLPATLVVSLLANAWFLSRDEPAVGFWRSEAGRAEYVRAYDRAMAGLPPHEARDVRTDFGTVRVYRFAPRASAEGADTTPIVLLPGWGSGAPMWGENLPGLLGLQGDGAQPARTVYALDALGDAGLSVQEVPLNSAQAQADWVAQTLRGLGLRRAHVVGHSFGGWAATNLAIHHPEAVATLSLLEPVQTFAGLRWQMYVASIPSAIPWLPRSWQDRALQVIGGSDEPIDRSDPVAAMIDAGTRGYVSKRSFPARPSDEQLRALPMPVYAAMAGNSAVTPDPEATVARARSLVPRIEARVWPGATHSLPMEQTAAIDAELLAFMAKNEPTRRDP